MPNVHLLKYILSNMAIKIWLVICLPINGLIALTMNQSVRRFSSYEWAWSVRTIVKF